MVRPGQAYRAVEETLFSVLPLVVVRLEVDSVRVFFVFSDDNEHVDGFRFSSP